MEEDSFYGTYMNQVVENFSLYYNAALSAINHLDTGDAFRALKNLDAIISQAPQEEAKSPEFQRDMSVLRQQLRYVAFPDLPQEEAQKILSSELMSFVMSGIDLEDRLSVRNVFTEYGERDNNREMMKKSILANTEVLGGIALQEWIRSFDQLFDPNTREDRAVLDFFTRNPKIAELSKTEQQVLKIILMAYEHWMATVRLDIIDLAYLDQNINKPQVGSVRSGIYENPMANEALERAEESRGRSSEINKGQQQVPNESLPLLKALGKFEKLGGQQVTNSKIVVKGQNDPVRPTIFNWLRAYRDELGVGAHDAVVRGQFLFHSLNGKGLTSDERDQVGMLLKSIDENSPLTIDAARQEVVFSESRITNPRLPARQEESRMGSKPLSRDIPNTKYEIQDTEKNISRAVFELPVIKNQESRIRNQESRIKNQKIQDTNQRRLSAFEQAKAIQAAARENQISMAKVASETVELGRVNTFPSAPPMTPRPRIEPAPQSTAPAPRAISFEPAKIDTFSFGASTVAPKPMAEQPLEPKFPAPEKSNVGSVSFSTKHVMQAEKEVTSLASDGGKPRANSQQITKPLPTLPLDPLRRSDSEARRGGGEKVAPIQKPVAPVNRYRITPTSRREETVKDDTPSPHVVDLRN